MGVYDAIKDCISLAQKADNFPLVSALIDAQKQVLDLLDEKRQLRERITELEKKDINERKVVRHEKAYITLRDDDKRLIYCACCWDRDRKLIQGQVINNEIYGCPICKVTYHYDRND